jgi:glutamyl-Q tRNA(Asp) synthetase
LNKQYRGRFAPSPTGPLHFGSLIAAVGSYLEARRNEGEWLLRIEDIDTPRCRLEWTHEILGTLEAFGFEWDGIPIYQNRRGDLYESALQRLAALSLTYPCGCSRREIADSSIRGIEGPVYPGTCRSGLAPGRVTRATRARTDAVPITFTDAIQGAITQNLAAQVGDFVVKRADGPVAYQLAVVVDDAEQGITHVARGADLLASTPRQIYLQRLLGYTTPAYCHLPVALNGAGEKLSKQTAAPATRPEQAAYELAAALRFLGHLPPLGLSLRECWAWSFAHWDPTLVPRVDAAQAPEIGDIDK